nr:CRISPR-associated endonuclease Cas1 [Ardenticatena sp.]
MAIVKYLLVDEFGTYVGKYSGRLRVTRPKTNEKLIEAPLIHLEAVCIMSNGVSLSSDAVRACAERGIPIYFLSGSGRAYAMLYSAQLTGTVATRRAQLAAYESPLGLHLARTFALGKVRNQVNLLRYFAKNYREKDPTLFTHVHDVVSAIQDVQAEIESFRTDGLVLEEARHTLLGLEGRAAHHYWAGVRLIMRQDFEWPGRETRGATDVFNQALNYGYGILYGWVERALLLAGLDPYGGFLHADRPGKPSLVLDSIEEFRQQVVDRALIALVNRGVSLSQEGTRLDVPTRRRIAEHVLKRLETPVAYEGRRLQLKSVVQSQARHLATFLRGERDAYEPFVGTW